MWRWTDAHFCWFLTVLEYSPIGKKIPLTTAPCTLYTIQEKNFENFQHFFVLKVLMYPTNFDVKICFLILFKTYIEYFFCFFYFRNLIKDYFVTISEEKKVEITTLKFFSNSAFSRFFLDFHHISYHISVSIRDIQIISMTMSPSDIRLKPKTFKWNIFLNIAL
jgi:hypothetical protein